MNIRIKLTRDENLAFFHVDRDTVMVMDMERYLLGVVPAEVGNAPLEACKAQAVAARTFALPFALKGDIITDQSSVHQAYRAPRSVDKAYANAHAAVEATAGEVLHYGGKLINTCSYSASNGGRTTSAAERWGGERAWLIAKDDPWDRAATGGVKRGHGVGMSQAGAKYAAGALGLGYRGVLSFYYDGTEVVEVYGESHTPDKEEMPLENSGMISPAALCAYALGAVGGGYCWGSSGETCSPKVRKELANRAPDQASKLLGVCTKWDGKKIWDCSGLFRGAWRKLLKYKSGGATTIFKTWCTEVGSIDTMPDEPGIAVFKGSGTTMSHIGLYMGGGMVADARGSSQGVLHGALTSYPWTHWGRLADVAYEGVEPSAPPADALYEAKVVGVKTSLNLRKVPSMDAGVTIGNLMPGARVWVLEDGRDDGFCRVRYQGLEGYCTGSYLTKV